MNTRFNPTANGSLHIGHIYMALLNEAMAHNSGGEFHIRFDDNTPHMMRHYIRQIPGKDYATTERALVQLNDLIWMGIEIDSVSYQSEQEEKMNKFLANSPFRMVIDNVGYGYNSRSVIAGRSDDFGSSPLSTRHTVEKVVLDYWDGSDVLIRGLEWVAEHHLYMYFCALFGFRFPLCHYVPRLLTAIGISGDRTVGDISKTIGNWSVQELHKIGASPVQIRGELRESCLIDSEGPWNINNLKYQPRLISEEVKDVLRR